MHISTKFRLQYLRIEFVSAMSAYLVAVTTASLTFVLPIQLIQYGIKNKPQLMFSFLMIVSGWGVTFVTALIPYLIGLAIAKFKMRSLWYFVIGALITSLVIGWLFLKIPILGINLQSPEPTIIQQYLRAVPFFIFSGLVAGYSCFWVLKKSNSISASLGA